ncbi:hypothetical protein [Marinobacter alexandrii]|uniref:hypothetical protein n=1 Tax=Marinobacter alexandrii TaxID=2570351 RepID=UPI00110923A9|nr:hypothetical protein [Marinobacter alexandrii]
MTGRQFFTGTGLIWTLSTTTQALQPDLFDIYGEVTGGYISDEALNNTSGRETQIWKMTQVLVGLVYNAEDSAWSARIEWVPLSDDLCFEPENAACGDIYKNLGTSLLYFGEHPVREAAARYQGDNWYADIGRIINPYGLSLNEAPYRHRHDAPHAYYIDKELVSGVNLEAQLSRWTASLGVFGGRGDPGSSYNYYLNGQVDPNLKGNNTPLFETTLAYRRIGRQSTQTLYGGYHHTKTGSAVGHLYSGKHNDERAQVGLDVTYTPQSSLITGYRLLAQYSQYSQYTLGLTTKGQQGRSTPIQSRDLVKRGVFATGVVEFGSRLELVYTYEELDRIDTLVWDRVANFDPSHPAFDSVERNHIVSIAYRFNRNVEFSAFFRQSDFDYAFVSDIEPETDTDKAGFLVHFQF